MYGDTIFNLVRQIPTKPNIVSVSHYFSSLVHIIHVLLSVAIYNLIRFLQCDIAETYNLSTLLK